MKDSVITARRKKKELIVLLCCFVIANILNLYAIIAYKTEFRELFTSLGYVLLFTIVLYAFLIIVRLVFYLVIRMMKKRKSIDPE